MSEFILSTDNTCDLPKDIISEHNIDIHNLYYAFGDDVYGDEKNMTEKDFYQTMRNGSMPTTMAINQERCRELFEKRLKDGYDILHLSFSSALSSTFSTAYVVANELREEYPERKIIVIDTLAASLGQGLIVYKAALLKKEGKPIDEVAKYVNDHLQNFCHFFTVDDLNDLWRGGRVSRATAILGNLINIKPVLHVNDQGQLIPFAKVRTRKKSLIALVDNMGEFMGSYKDKNDVCFIGHGDCIEDAQFVADLIKERYGIPAILNYICPTIGAHTGPSILALFFMGDSRMKEPTR